MKDQLQYYHRATLQDTGGTLPSNVLIKDYPELGCLIICKDSLYFYLYIKPLITAYKKFSFLIIYYTESSNTNSLWVWKWRCLTLNDYLTKL